jgi:hypothetical protein
MPIGNQDGGGVPMAPAVLAGRVDKLFDLALGQILTGRVEGRLTVTFTDLGAQRTAAVFSMVFPLVEYQLLQFYR